MIDYNWLRIDEWSVISIVKLWLYPASDVSINEVNY